MSQKASLTFEHDPDASFSLEAGSDWLIGRSQECDFQIPDSFVSRRQAKIQFMNGQFLIENIGSNPIFVNGTEAVKRILSDDDRITLGKTQLVFHMERGERDRVVEPSEDVPVPEQTIIARSSKEYGARLAVATPDGKDQIHSLSGRQVVIGRLAEADIRLDDPSVSRRHCVIERRDEHFFVRNLSETNPTVKDNRPVAEEILYSGDQLKIGMFTVSFLSDRPEDARPHAHKIVYGRRRLSTGLWLAVSAMILVLAGFFCYSKFYTPWKIRNTLQEVSRQIDSANFQSAHETLKKLLSLDLPPKESQTAIELFSKTTLLQAKKMAEDGKIREARDYLVSFLNNYKTGKESKAIRDQVDAYRFQLAQELEASGENLAALQEYSGIGEESTYFDQAQQAISRIWLASQQKELSRQPIDQLMQEAEENFAAKRYTTPFNNNAYAIFQTILSLDPGNAVATQRIDQMKLFYRENGDKYFQQKNYASALSYYERYLLIDPQDAGVNEKAAACRKAITSRRAPHTSTRSAEGQDSQKERVKRLFEDSEAN